MTPQQPRPIEPMPGEDEDSITAHVRWAVSTFPQIDPEVEGIVSRLDKAHRHLRSSFRASLGQAGLSKDEWKILMSLRRSARSHGWLSRDQKVSTGAMTNRLDKLERHDLVRRVPHPTDRRGVLLEITAAGRARLERYVDVGASRERELLSDLSQTQKRQLNQLLTRLLASVERRSGHAP